jgi:hypothetical protein
LNLKIPPDDYIPASRLEGMVSLSAVKEAILAECDDCKRKDFHFTSANVSTLVFANGVLARLTAPQPKPDERIERLAETLCQQRGYRTVTEQHRKDAVEIDAIYKADKEAADG